MKSSADLYQKNSSRLRCAATSIHKRGGLLALFISWIVNVKISLSGINSDLNVLTASLNESTFIHQQTKSKCIKLCQT